MEWLHKKNIDKFHPNWSGKTICPECGKNKKHESKVCYRCKPLTNSGSFLKGKKHKYYGLLGTAHYNYKNGELVKWIRDSEEYVLWRKSVFERDRFICQECNIKHSYIEAHHIQSFISIFNKFLQEYNQFSPLEDKDILRRIAMNHKPFWDIDNGKTLCKKCHNKYKQERNTYACNSL